MGADLHILAGGEVSARHLQRAAPEASVERRCLINK
jgi:hypothetical protein